MVDDMHERVLEHHLRRRRLVEAALRILAVRDVLDAQHRVRVPHVFLRDRLAENLLERGGVGLAQDVARPVGEVAVDEDLAVRPQAEDFLQRLVIGVGAAVIVAIGGGAHVAALARQPGPAALRRGDHRVENAERVEHAVVGVEQLHAAVLDHIERDGAHVAEAIEHRHHHRPFLARKGRHREGKPGVVFVMRRADQIDRRVEAELVPDMARGAVAAVEVARVEQRRAFAPRQHAQAGRGLLQERPYQRGRQRGIVPGAEPGIDAVRPAPLAGKIGAHRLDRLLRIGVGVLDAGKALFFVVQDRPRTGAGNLDQRHARIMRAGGGNAGQRHGLAALDLVLEVSDARAREIAAGAVDVPPPVNAFQQWQREVKARRAEPRVACPDPHDAACPR